MRGYRPVRKGIRFYKTLVGIRKKLRHRVKRVQPMSAELLTKIQTLVDYENQKELTVWTALVTGFKTVLRKSNLVPYQTCS